MGGGVERGRHPVKDNYLILELWQSAFFKDFFQPDASVAGVYGSLTAPNDALMQR